MHKLLFYLLAFTMTVQVSAYTPYECGSNISAMGKPCVEGRTVALNGVPLGSVVEYNGARYVVEDRCGIDGVLDIFMEDFNRAIEFGRKYNQRITVYTP